MQTGGNPKTRQENEEGKGVLAAEGEQGVQRPAPGAGKQQ